MWRRAASFQLRALTSHRRSLLAVPVPHSSRSLSSASSPSPSSGEKFAITTGHEKEELQAELEEAPAIVKSVYDKRIVGCPGGEAEDEHNVVWFWLEKGKPYECPLCSQYFTLVVVGPGGPPDGHETY